MTENITTGELKIMVDNLKTQMEENRQDIMRGLNEIKSDVKEIKSQTASTANTVIKHDIWIKNFWWFCGFLGGLIILIVPVIRWIELQDIRNAQQETADKVVSTLESKYDLTILK